MHMLETPSLDAAHVTPDDLRDLMRSVDETARRLQSTHVELHREVARLRGELAQANAQLRRSRALAALGEMAAGIAHEVRNPLGSIQLYVQMLSEDLSDRPDQAELCGKINRAVGGIDAIVRDVLLFARETRLDPRQTTTEVLIDRALESCAALLADGSVTVDHSAIRALDVQADEGLLSTALTNIIRNAVEAMRSHEGSDRALRLSTARRRVRCPGGDQAMRIVISVRDTGPGIDPAVLERMFNPFFTTRSTGTGLGLAIVHRIVEAHGGHINVRNHDADASGGATFELCLPRKIIQPEQTSAHDEPGAFTIDTTSFIAP